MCFPPNDALRPLPPPGFIIPLQSPHLEGPRSPPAGAPAVCAVEASIPQPELLICIMLLLTAASPLYQFVRVKDLNSTVSEDGLLTTSNAFVTQAAPCSPPLAHECIIPAGRSTMPPTCSHHCGVRRLPARMSRYQGPPQQAQGSSTPHSPLLPPLPVLRWPLPPSLITRRVLTSHLIPLIILT